MCYGGGGAKREDGSGDIHSSVGNYYRFGKNSMFNCSSVSVPVVTSFYLLIRVWWVLCGMDRDGTVLSRTESGDETEEDIEILAEDKNGNNNGNGKHLDR